MQTPLLQLGKRLAPACLAVWFIASTASAEIRLNEFVAATSKSSEPKDADGDTSDWLEIHNPDGELANLAGYFLTDDTESPRKWALPAVEIPANGYLLVFASGKDRTDPAAELHTDFQLNRAEGSYLALTRNGAGGVSEVVTAFNQYPQQRDGTSFGIMSVDPEVTVAYFSTPTPREANNEGEAIEGFVSDTKFSVSRGFFTEAFNVEITSETPGSTIIYTTDGSFPSAENGTKVVAASAAVGPKATVNIKTTTPLRAMAVKDGYAPTNVDTQTFIFTGDVLQQTGEDLESVRWGHAGEDWEMDPDIVDHEDPESRVVADDLLRIPTVAVAMPFDKMFGRGGIYISGEKETDCAIEYFNHDGSTETPNEGPDFQVDGSIQIVGGSSTGRWKSDNLSMRLVFQPDLDFSFFGGAAARSFDTLVLDARLNFAWHYGGGSDPTNQRGQALFVRDQLNADLQREVGGLSPHGQHVHFYINGIYWGIRMLHERPDDNFAASYLGGDGGEDGDHYAVKHQFTNVVTGGRDASNSMRALDRATRDDLEDPTEYAEVASVLDVDDFINYMLMNYYVGNTDWPHQNWYATMHHGDPNGKWRFHSWDAEHSWKSERENVVTKTDGPAAWQGRLMKNPEYALRFADLVQKHFFNGGALTPAAVEASFRRRLGDVDLPIRAQSARWGDNWKRTPYTRGKEWMVERDRILTKYIPGRTETVLTQIQRKKWLPGTEAPAFSQYGGDVASGYSLEMQSSDGANIFYSMDGADPRMTGDPPEDVIVIGESYPKKAFVPTEDIGSDWRTQITAEGCDDSAWNSGNLGAGYERTNGGAFEEFFDDGLNFLDQMWSKNATVYMRSEFDLSELLGPTDSLNLFVRHSGGFVAYLNGTEVARADADETNWNSEATDDHSDSEAKEFVEFNISAHRDALVVGKNLFAVHGMNKRNGSSDMLIHPVLIIGAAGGEGGVVSTSATLYDSPVRLTKSGKVKARALSSGGEWSALTNATFLVDTEPASKSNLVVSEIHYRPLAPSEAELAAGFNGRTDFEFAEFQNIGSKTIDLVGVQVTAGISFNFAGSLIKLLEPGEHLLVVESIGAFTMRYGASAAARIAGKFAGGSRLANGGETITVVNALPPQAEQTIKSFTYDDVSPWPTSPDGDGFSLVLKTPATNPNHDVAANWQASAAIGGSPGFAEGEVPSKGFDAWLAEFGLTGADPNSDTDGDGQSLLVEYAGGALPGDASSILVVTIRIDAEGNAFAGYWRPIGGAPGIEYTLEQTAALNAWAAATGQSQITAPADAPDGLEFVETPLGNAATSHFVRLKVQQR